MNSKRYLWGLIALFFAITSNAVADSPQYIELQGLTLPCDRCTVNSQGQCEITVDGERILTSCESATDQLLHMVSHGSYDGAHPAPEQLREFLIREKVSPTTAVSVLKLLCSNEASEQVLRTNLPAFVGRYEDQFVTLAIDRKCSKGIWSAVWHLPVTQGNKLSPRLMATVAARSEVLTLDDLLGELSVTDPDGDLRMLGDFVEALADIGSPWVTGLTMLRERLLECLPIFGADVIPEQCSTSGWKSFEPAISRYLARVQTHTVVTRLTEEQPAPLQVLKVLRTTDYLAHRTPEVHRLLQAALQKLQGTGSSDEYEQVTVEPLLQMLEVFAKSDAEVAKVLAEVEVKAAKALAEDNEVIPALDVLQRSFAVFPERFESRALLLDALRSHPALMANKELKQKLQKIDIRPEENEDPATQEKGASGWAKQLFKIVALIVLCAFGLSIARSIRKGRETRALQLLSDDERRELQDIYHYFEIAPWAQERELTQRYHERAKLVHPDTGGDKRQFAELTEKYQRALELIHRRAKL